jgi:hypothetical protein
VPVAGAAARVSDEMIGQVLPYLRLESAMFIF